MRPFAGSPSGSANCAQPGDGHRSCLAEEPDLHQTDVDGIERGNESMYDIAKPAHDFGIPIADLFPKSRKSRLALRKASLRPRHPSFVFMSADGCA